MNIKEKIQQGNEAAVRCLINADPVWVDVLPAIDCIDGMTDYMILHSGPPIDYHDMVALHRRGLISATLYEGWASNAEEAQRLIASGKVKIESCLDHNTVGAGTGIISKSIVMIVTEDRNSGKRAATFPAEGQFQGGMTSWGLYSEEIVANLHEMRDVWLPVLRELIQRRGGLALKPILAESLQLGDENHTRQTVADYIFDKQILPDLMEMDIPNDLKCRVMHYIVDTPRFFHSFGQGASRAALLAAEGTKYSTMVTSVCGNGVEFGIQIAGLPGKWFTVPAPMMDGRYTSTKFTKADQIPWCGDSCIIECAGMGGTAAAASPIVCSLRGMTLNQSIAQTREMEKICITKNPNYAIPNLDFDCLPVGMDIRKVLKTGITPIIHGGMFNKEGGLIGAGMARIPMECFVKAMKAFAAEYSE